MNYISYFDVKLVFKNFSSALTSRLVGKALLMSVNLCMPEDTSYSTVFASINSYPKLNSFSSMVNCCL